MTGEGKMHGATIRRGELSDAGRISKLHGELFREGWSEQSFEELLRARNVIGLVSTSKDNTIMGFAFFRIAADEAEVLTIGVTAARQGQGIASELLRAGCSSVFGEGVRRVFLEVAASNTAALALYRREGFELVGRRAGYYTRSEGGKEDAIVMSLTLATPNG